MIEWIVENLKGIDGYTVEWAEPGQYLLSRRNQLYRADSLHTPFEFLFEVPAPFWKSSLARLRLAQRTLRFSFYNILKLSSGRFFISFDQTVGVFSEDGYSTVSGFNRPFRILRGACALDGDGSVVFGEYVANIDRSTEILIYRYQQGSGRVDAVHRFAPGEIRHVHGVYSDPFDSSLWCLCGDVGDECRILRTWDVFQTIETVGMGDETWRSVSIQFTPAAVYYAMDAEFQPNFIFRIDRKTGRRECVAEIEGPVYYSQAIGRDLFFAVTAELCPSQKGSAAVLWHVDQAGAASRVTAFEKDRWPVKYCLPGTLSFPRGADAKSLLFQATALAGVDNRTFRVTMAGA